MAGRKSSATRDTNTKAKKKLTKKEQQQRKILLVILEVICVILLFAILYVWSFVGKIDFNPFDRENAGINSDLSDDALLTQEGYTNIAIFGLDNRSEGNYNSGNSDVIMIASINNKTREVRLVSVFRDTYLNVGDGKYNKANYAFARGGVEQAVQMLNTNLDLTITEYVCVDWAALIEAIDALGGVEIEITDAEVKYINMYVSDMHGEIGSKLDLVEGSGKQTLSGVQATAYARIRYTAGSDFKRASRQRIVLEAMLNKAKQSDLGTLLDICNLVFDDISTSLELTEILGLASHVAEYNIGATTGFPFELTTGDVGKTGDCVIPVGLEDDVTQLHYFMFGVENYDPSPTVKAISNTIIAKTGVTEDSATIDISDYNDTAGQDGTNFDD